MILILRNEEEVSAAYSGDNIRVKLKGVEEEVWSTGIHEQYIYNYIHVVVMVMGVGGWSIEVWSTGIHVQYIYNYIHVIVR